MGHVGMRGSRHLPIPYHVHPLTLPRIVEYATRDQAQAAVNTLSNQNLMGRLVYVREVSLIFPRSEHVTFAFWVLRGPVVLDSSTNHLSSL